MFFQSEFRLQIWSQQVGCDLRLGSSILANLVIEVFEQGDVLFGFSVG
jgi:hypothetical protein